MPTARALRPLLLLGAIARALPATAGGGGPTLLGPIPYVSQADSPFDLSDLDVGFYLEDFEDNLLNTPGVTPSTGSLTGPGGLTDSVDADDGLIDGSGTNGRSFFSSPGSTGITFTFDQVALGAFPTAAGIVWTDGEGDTTFEAFDALGGSLGVLGPVAIATGGVTGETDEDSFFGVFNPGGISAIHISNVSGGIEVDHLQYGNAGLASATTTTTILTTTTTTAPPAHCTGPAAATFASIRCRLEVLIDRVETSSEIRRRRALLADALNNAGPRTGEAWALCASGNAKQSRKRLKQAIRKIIQFGHRLRTRAGKRSMPEALRAELIATGNVLKTDLQALRGALSCPADALAG